MILYLIFFACIAGAPLLKAGVKSTSRGITPLLIKFIIPCFISFSVIGGIAKGLFLIPFGNIEFDFETIIKFDDDVM